MQIMKSTDKETIMTHKFQILFTIALVGFAAAPAQAEHIIWKQPSSKPALHQNLNFEGNASLTPADTRKLQKALAAKGFYKGRIDGIWGGQTSQALLDYQAVNQQALTGTVTAATLRDLGVHIDKQAYN